MLRHPVFAIVSLRFQIGAMEHVVNGKEGGGGAYGGVRINQGCIGDGSEDEWAGQG